MQNKQADSFLNNFGNTLLLLILVVQALILKRDKVRGRSFLELLLTVTNVASFMIVNFYFDV